MIILLHPRSTRPKNRRFPLSVLSLAAVLEGREDYVIIDGNADPDPGATLDRVMHETPAELLAVSVMPGPQMAAAIPLCREFRRKYPDVPVVWGGYFPSLYPEAVLRAGYVDFAVIGQGEDTFAELIEALHDAGGFSSIQGLAYTDGAGEFVRNPERAFRSPNDFPHLPYHRVEAVKYILPTFLGSRTAVHQASVGCPYQCSFCAVITAYDSREKMEDPARTEGVLRGLQREYGINAVQFYDNNFFLQEDHAREQAERFAPLGLRWWCEARIDAVLRFSDDTLEKLRRAGLTMVFFGAESGSDEILRQMKKNLTCDQTLALAERLHRFGITPEFSFVVGNPADPEGDARDTIAFVRKIKKLNPDAEIILQHYSPTPQRERMYGGVEDRIEFPATLEEWATQPWLDFVNKTDPDVPWTTNRIQRRIDNFELVVSSRWPTAQDITLPGWGRSLLRGLSGWRYRFGVYDFPFELRFAQRIVELRKPQFESL